jgi:hypothetical protein
MGHDEHPRVIYANNVEQRLREENVCDEHRDEKHFEQNHWPVISEKLK